MKELYLVHKEEFIIWMAKHFETSEDQGREFYQEAYLSFIENVISGKLVSLTSSIKTYLFSIGKYKFLDHKRRQERERQGDSTMANMVVEPIQDNDMTDSMGLRKALAQLGEPCSKMLQLFYFKKESIKEITEKLGYKNTQTAKNQKYKCLNRLREIMKKGNKHD